MGSRFDSASSDHPFGALSIQEAALRDAYPLDAFDIPVVRIEIGGTHTQMRCAAPNPLCGQCPSLHLENSVSTPVARGTHCLRALYEILVDRVLVFDCSSLCEASERSYGIAVLVIPVECTCYRRAFTVLPRSLY
jgi:hypothetical protein